MRFLFILLLLPMAVMASCPHGINLGYVDQSYPRPACIPYSGSKMGGCYVDCRDLCINLPNSNRPNAIGPVYTTGAECALQGGEDGGDQGGDEGGDDGTGGEDGGGENGGGDNGGTTEPPMPNYPMTYVGRDATGDLAPLFNGLGWDVRSLGTNIDLVSESVHKSIQAMRQEFKISRRQTENLLPQLSSVFYDRQSMAHLQSIDDKMSDLLIRLSKPTVPDTKPDPKPDSSGGTDFWANQLSKDLLQNTYSTVAHLDTIKSNTAPISGYLSQLNGTLSYMASRNAPYQDMLGLLNSVSQSSSSNVNQNNQIVKELKAIKDALNTKGETGGTGDGNGNGSKGEGVDYSKMPGSADNPLHVLDGKYASNCHGDNCFFDVPAIEKQLMDANDKLKQKQDDIAKDVKSIFDFSLSGGARVMECFDLFSYNGRDYRVCPPSGEYWQTLAALMMFIFYFVALMVIFRR